MAARLHKIVYGTLVLGKDQTEASYELTGSYSFLHGWATAELEFDVIVANSTRATFLTAEAALLLAFRTPDQALEVSLGGTARHSFDPSGNTGFLARPTIALVDSGANCATYRVRVEVQLPASLNSRVGRREATTDVEEDPAELQTVRVAGVWTATSAGTARAVYKANIATWANSQLGLLTGTFELDSDSYNFDDQNKVATFVRTYRQVVGNQGDGTLDVTGIVRPTLEISRRTVAQQAALGTLNRLPVELSVSYHCWVRQSVSTDLPGFYETTIRPAILAHCSVVAGSTAIIEEEDPRFFPHEQRVAVTMRLRATGNNILAMRVSTKELYDTGMRVYPVFNEEDIFDADVYQGPGLHLLQVTRIAVVEFGQQLGDLGLPAVDVDFVLRTVERERERYESGVDSRRQFEATVETWTYQRATGKGLLRNEPDLHEAAP